MADQSIESFGGEDSSDSETPSDNGAANAGEVDTDGGEKTQPPAQSGEEAVSTSDDEGVEAAPDDAESEAEVGEAVIDPTDLSFDEGRKKAVRVSPLELSDATFTFSESDDDRAANHTLLPTGGHANRVFIVGTLTETNRKDSSHEGVIATPDGGTISVYAGQYEPEAEQFLKEIETPAYVAITAKPNHIEFTDDDGEEVVIPCLRPDDNASPAISKVDEATFNNWLQEMAEATLQRIQQFGDDPVSELVDTHYDSDTTDYKKVVVEAAHQIQSD